MVRCKQMGEHKTVMKHQQAMELLRIFTEQQSKWCSVLQAHTGKENSNKVSEISGKFSWVKWTK